MEANPTATFGNFIDLYSLSSTKSLLRHNLSELRFLSASSSRTRTCVRPIKMRLIDKPQKKDPGEGQDGNISVLVKGTSENSERIVRVELHKEAIKAYMAYTMSVLLGRALPDICDGLKPVHRRILYAMHELRIVSWKPFKKCARVVGEVLGKFHPHEDIAVYDSLVRMAHDFSLRFPLIQGHRNFGSIDADPAAAMHYTECRLEAHEQKNQKFSEIKVGLDDAKALIRKIDLEVRSLQSSVKAVLLAKLREYKSDLHFPSYLLLLGYASIYFRFHRKSTWLKDAYLRFEATNAI